MTMYPTPDSHDANPYPVEEPVPYEPDTTDLGETSPPDYSPPGPPLITPEEAIAGVSDPDATVTP